MKLFEHTLFINLAHRTDRLEQVENELKKVGIQGERIDAIRNTNGALGCTMSHIKCIQTAKDRDYSHVFICEDDITFTKPEVFKQSASKFEKSSDIDWDVLIIGGNNVPPYTKVSDFCIRTYNCQTTTGYVVKKRMYDIFLRNFKESSEMLMKTGDGKMYALDIYWKRLQSGYFWYMLIPPTVIQRDDYSDIEQKQTKYDWLMLDLDKKWYVQQQRSLQLLEQKLQKIPMVHNKK